VTYVSTACLGRPELWSALNALAGAGIDSVELGACTLDGTDDLASRLRATGLRLAVHNYFPPTDDGFVINLASPSADVRGAATAFVERALALASAVGAPFYSVHAGFASDPVGHDDGHFVFSGSADLDAARLRFADSLAGLAETARSLGVELLVENNVCIEQHRGYLLLVEGDEIASFLAPLGARLLLDTGHLNVSAATFGFDRERFVETVEDVVGALHLHDNDGTADRHAPLSEEGWIAELLRRPALRSVPRVLEARVATPAEARRQADLADRLAASREEVRT
jgi:sugar phosphate isomerase/epimerase